MNDGEILKQARRDWRPAFVHWGTWRTEAREDYGFVAGDQWSNDAKAELEEQMRPAVTFNRVAPVIDAVSGMEVSNRQEVRYIPRELGDVGINEVLTAGAEWVRDQCDAEDEESDAFLDSVICGMGWTETRLSYDDDEDGEIKIERVDPLEMYADPKARKRNLSDGNYVFRVKDFSKSEFDEKWPDADIVPGDEWGWASDSGDDPVDRTQEHVYEGFNDDKVGDREKDMVRVVEYQWFEREPVIRVRSPADGSVVSLNNKKFGAYRVQMAQAGMQLREGQDYVRQKRKVAKRAFLTGSTVLETGDAPVEQGFSYKAITAKRDRNKGTWYGLVRAMKDPQRWANKFFAQILHIINSNAKGGLLAEEGVFKDIRKAEEDWARSDSIIEVASGKLDRVKEKGMAEYPASIDRLMEFTISSIRDVTGVNLELLGLADRNQAGVLEAQRKQAGMTILSTLFDSFRRYRKEQGRLLLRMIQEYISDGRLIRMSDTNGQRYVPLVRDPDVVRYDVIVDDAPSSPNQKERIWTIIQQMLPMITELPAAEQILLEVVKYSPLPESMVQNIAKTLQNAEPDPEEVKRGQMEEAEKTADIDKTKSEAERNRAQANKANADAGTGREKTGNERLKIAVSALSGAAA